VKLPSSGRTPSLSAIFGVVFLDLLGFGILIPQLGVYAVKYQASPFWVGLLVSVYSLMQFLAAPWLGRLSDVHGRRPVLLVSLVGSLAGYLLFAVADSFALLFLSRIIDGISGGNLSAAQAYVADVTTPENRAKGMGIIGAGFGLGFILGPALGGFLGAKGGNAAIGLFCVALSAINLLWVALYLPESRRPGSARAKRPLISLSSLRLPVVSTVIATFGLFTLGFAQMEGTFSVFLFARHFQADGWIPSAGELWKHVEDPRVREISLKAGYIFTVIGVVSALIQGGLIGPLKRRLGEPRLVLWGCVLTALGLGCLPLAPSFAWLFLPAMVMGAGSALSNPALSSLVSQHAPQSQQGEVLGSYQAVGALGRIAGPAFGGFLFSSVSPGAPYVSAAVLVAGCAALSLRLQGRRIVPGS
jgi:DHA1 family tetracycline resistance protein-like MFS transporter